jgi:hypothetical protein
MQCTNVPEEKRDDGKEVENAWVKEVLRAQPLSTTIPKVEIRSSFVVLVHENKRH